MWLLLQIYVGSNRPVVERPITHKQALYRNWLRCLLITHASARQLEQAHTNFSTYLLSQSDYPYAEAEAQAAVLAAQRVKPDPLAAKARALIFLAGCLQAQGKFAVAINLLQDALGNDLKRGAPAATLARDYNDISVANFLLAETKRKAERQALLSNAVKMAEQADKLSTSPMSKGNYAAAQKELTYSN